MFSMVSGKRDSNPQPLPWQGKALPIKLFPRSLTQPKWTLKKREMLSQEISESSDFSEKSTLNA